jgi:hypothetical protein
LNKWGNQGRTWVQQLGIGRRVFFGALAAWLVAMLVWTAALDVMAAIELAYFRGSATNTSVLLEWATIREVNLNGFEILCKRAVESDAAYHPIGSRIAQGGPETGAVYSFNVTAGLVFGESYCFRLREVTADDTPGEVFELCGFGPGLTPTPTVPGAVLTLTVPVTVTAIVVESLPGLEPAPTLIPTETPTPAFFDPNQPVSPLTPPLDPNQPVSPLSLPGAVDPNLVDPNAASIQQQTDPYATPTLDPATVDPWLALPTAIPTETPTLTPIDTETPTPTWTPLAQSPLPLAVDPNLGQTAALAETAGTEVEVTPTPIYVVQTATPTPEGLAVIPPTFTPWPTSTPTPGFSLTNLVVPNTQNLMVMLLCLIFVSASGLGALGLVTSVLYMRSQARRTRLPTPYDRRRY